MTTINKSGHDAIKRERLFSVNMYLSIILAPLTSTVLGTIPALGAALPAAEDPSSPNPPKSTPTPSSIPSLPIDNIADPGGRKIDDEEYDGDTSDAELAYNAEERRLEHQQALFVGVGESRPWQALSLAMGLPVDRSYFVGLAAGVGRQPRTGIVQNKTYDMDVSYASVGVLGRIYSQKFPHLSVEPSFTLNQWSGDISPFGLDPDEENPEVLSGGFRATGASFGLGCVATWFLSEDVSLDWTFVGLKKAWLFSRSNTRFSPWIEAVTHRVLTTPQFFGLTSITIGFWHK